jgi:hypothetical protein
MKSPGDKYLFFGEYACNFPLTQLLGHSPSVMAVPDKFNLELWLYSSWFSRAASLCRLQISRLLIDKNSFAYCKS